MPQRLYLVRHARAEGSNPRGDAARALTAAGRAAFEAHLRALRPELLVRRVVTSPYLRARETAGLLAAALGVPVEDEPALASGEHDGPGVLRLAARLGPGVALVGHNPELAHAAALAAGRELELPPGGVVALDVEGAHLRLAWIRVP